MLLVQNKTKSKMFLQLWSGAKPMQPNKVSCILSHKNAPDCKKTLRLMIKLPGLQD